MDERITLYQQKLNLYNASFERIEHEDAMVATVYKVTPCGGKQSILKISTRTKDYFRELYFLNHFAGLLPVPSIKGLVPPEKGVDGAILMEYIPGSLLEVSQLTHAMAYEIGSLLARIHCSRVEGYGDLTKPESLTSDPRVHFFQKFEEGIDECKGNLSQLLLDQCRQYADKHSKLLSLTDGPCIVHRDFRPGNILVHQGKLQAIIDWAASAGSFAEEDLCSLEHNWVLSPSAKSSFLAGYASIRPVPDYQPLMPLLRLNKALATLGFTVKQGTWKDVRAFLYERNLHFLKNFLTRQGRV